MDQSIVQNLDQWSTNQRAALTACIIYSYNLPEAINLLVYLITKLKEVSEVNHTLGFYRKFFKCKLRISFLKF